jgi:hypothetical protein
MNKKTKVVIGAVVIVALFIIALALNFPPVFKGKSSGTFGKADRYHKSQMSEKDILLRSKLTSDTVELKKMLQGLVYFTVFTKDLCIKIDNCVNVFQEQGLNSKDPGFSQLMLLKDYSSFIKNNNETLGNTISLLKGFYFKENVDESADVEKNLRDFGNYVKTLGERDDVLETALKGMDNFLVSSNIMKERTEELKKLKSIRDQLLMQGIQLAGLVQDNAMGTRLLSYSLSSQQQLQIYTAQDNLQMHAQDKLQQFMAQDKLQAGASEKLQMTGSHEINTLFTAREPGLSVFVYNRENLSFFYAAKEDLNAAQSSLQFDASEKIQVAYMGIGDINVIPVGIIGIGIFAQDGLQIVMSNYDLKAGYLGIGLGAVNSIQLEGVLYGQTNLGFFFNAADVLNSLHN